MFDPTMLAKSGAGFMEMGSDTFEELQKALTAGQGVDASQFEGGRALIPESLDATLVNILHTQDEAVLFQRLKKQPIKSPVHQWNERDEVGADDAPWVPEGGESKETNQDIRRKFEHAKYLQTLREVTLQASISNIVGFENAMIAEQNAGTLWLIRNVERALFNANSEFVADQPNGLDAQIPTSNILDVRGAQTATGEYENKLNEASRIIRENYGRAELHLGTPRNIEDIQKLIRDRIVFRSGDNRGGTGVFDRYPTPFGNIEIKEDVFIEVKGEPRPSIYTSDRPAVPTAGTPATTADAASEFVVADAGTYFYKIVALNRYGDSVASTAVSATVAAGEKVSIEITDGSGPTPTAYKVYRSRRNAANGDDVRHAFTVAKASAGNTTIEDLNHDLPGTMSSYVLTMSPERNAIEWFQFLPMMKFDLYPTNRAVYPFLMLLFGALALKKPTQHVRIKNISPADLDWFE